MPREPNPNAVAAFTRALDRHHDFMNLYPHDDPSVDLFHLIASAIDWCAAQNPPVDFDAALAEVREHFAMDAQG